jgi:calcineurin-like phosphoesterase family protein/2'-5' RNA ligase
MATFLIELRLRGYAREYAKWARECTRREARKLGVRKLREARFVPHVTLFGPAETRDLKNVIREVKRVCQKYTLVPFELGVKRGEFQNKDANWLYLEIDPSPELQQLRYELAQTLIRQEQTIHDTCQPYDHHRNYKFHCSIGKYDPRSSATFERLADYAETKCSLEVFRHTQATVIKRLFNLARRLILRVSDEEDLGINQHLLRVTVLGKRGRIQAEYDLVLSRMLSRKQALSTYWWRKTIAKFKELRRLSTEGRLWESDRSVYFIGDTHFDHKKIIAYCHRPFRNVREMNEAMARNWNRTVRENDTVYFLGDWSFSRGARPAAYWKQQVKGTVVSIRGSHDRCQSGIQFQDFEELHVGGYDFLLIHNPNPNDKHQTQEQKQKLRNWHGWVIHGHVHNSEMDNYPFINGERKTINVSVELINYRPVSLDCLLSLDLDSMKRMRTIDSQPERW